MQNGGQKEFLSNFLIVSEVMKVNDLEEIFEMKDKRKNLILSNFCTIIGLFIQFDKAFTKNVICSSFNFLQLIRVILALTGVLKHEINDFYAEVVEKKEDGLTTGV